VSLGGRADHSGQSEAIGSAEAADAGQPASAWSVIDRVARKSNHAFEPKRPMRD
jgi:hypothetical protein